MTTHQKNQIDMALQLYQRRGEFDGRSVAQARECLTRAGYTWDRDLASYVKQKLRQTTKRANRQPTKRGRGQEIVAARVTTYPDTGQTMVVIDWSDRSSTQGSPNSAHMQALIKRAEREGVRVRYGLFETNK